MSGLKKLVVDVNPNSSIIRGMIDITERDNRTMFLHYMIENLENGLKYVASEARVNSDHWDYIKRTIEKIDADMERLVVVVKTDKREEEEQTRYKDEVKGIKWKK